MKKESYDPAFWDTEIRRKHTNEKLLPISTGGRLPDIRIPREMALWQNVPGNFNYNDQTFHGLAGRKPLVISILSGGWNRYGLQHLNTLKEIYPEILALNGNLLVILNASYTDSLEMIQHFQVKFNVIVDPENQIATRFGVYSETAPVWDYISGISEDVPIPATFVSDTSGTIIYHSEDHFFEKVFPATEVLGAVFAAAQRVPYSNRYRFA